MIRKPRISVVVPVFNEEKSLPILYKSLKKVLDKLKKSYEIIFVDDGSYDSSFSVLEQINGEDEKHTRLIKLRKNFGKGEALSCGFNLARGEVIVTIDADLQDDPQEIPKLLNKLNKGADIVSGWKRQRKDPITKKIPSYLFNLASSIVMGLRLHDINCGLKVYRRQVLDAISIRGDLYRFIPLLAYQLGFSVDEVPVRHRKRMYGKSKYGFKRLAGALIDLLTVFFLTRYRAKPSHFFSMPGLALFIVGVLSDGYVAFIKLSTGTTQGHIPLLLFGILAIIVGIQLISLGLLGELYLSSSERLQHYIKYSSYEANDRRVLRTKRV